MMENRNRELPDYLYEGFKVPIEFGGIRTYASVNASMAYEEDGLTPDGTYFIYLLHHRLGSCYFTMELDENEIWIPINASPEIEDEIFKIIGETICCNKM